MNVRDSRVALSQYFDLGMGQKGYEEEGSRDGSGAIWGDTLRMCQHNQFCMTYLFYNHHPCRLSTVSMEVERRECTGRGGLSGEEGKARTTREQIKQVHVSFIYNSSDT